MCCCMMILIGTHAACTRSAYAWCYIAARAGCMPLRCCQWVTVVSLPVLRFASVP